MDYAMPRASDGPAALRLAEAERPSPSPHSPLGAKGVGEAGCVVVPAAVVNAVADALASEGVVLDRVTLPLTPERIWRALSRVGKRTNA